MTAVHDGDVESHMAGTGSWLMEYMMYHAALIAPSCCNASLPAFSAVQVQPA